jgi:iron(III) transport system substrate-binding protein
VAAGRYAWGLTDTDDAVIELERGESVILVFPDQGPDQAGTLLIPNSLCILKDAPHRDHARTLIDYLLRPEIEQRLNAGSSAQIPLSQHPKEPSRIAPANLKIRQVDFDSAARKWDSARTKLFEIFK